MAFLGVWGQNQRMQRLQLAACLMIVSALCAMHSFLGATPARAASTDAPSENLDYDLVVALLRNANKPLPKQKHCDFHITGKSTTPLLGEWIAWNLSFFEDGRANSLGAACRPSKPGVNSCTLDFKADSKGDSPWTCGFKFDYAPKSRKIDFSTLECTGTC
jgi:hypothetical protein